MTKNIKGSAKVIYLNKGSIKKLERLGKQYTMTDSKVIEILINFGYKHFKKVK